MDNSLPIVYRGFWDFPRIFIVEYHGLHLLFDNKFDSVIDDYPDTYDVFVLPDTSVIELDRSWNDLSDEATHHIGKVLTKDILFDTTKRRSIDAHVINEYFGSTLPSILH